MGKTSRAAFSTAAVSAFSATSVVDMQLDHGNYKVPLQLPNKGLRVFSLREDKEMTTFVLDVLAEDSSVKSVQLFTTFGERIARSTPVAEVLRGDWLLKVNDTLLHVRSPPRSHVGDEYVSVPHETLGEAEFGKMAAIISALQGTDKTTVALSEVIEKAEDGGLHRDKAEQILKAMHKLGQVFYFSKNPELRQVIFLSPKKIVGKIEESLNLIKLRETRQTVIARIEQIQQLLAPMHEKYDNIEQKATRRVMVLAYGLLLFLCAQFALFARLTWWDSSWDVMEPVTWAATSFETLVFAYLYFLLVGEEYSNEGIKAMLVHRRVNKLAKRTGFDLKQYQALQDELKACEEQLKFYPDHD